MSDITSFFQRVWKNIWKEKFLWLFSGVFFISQIPLFITPNQKSLGLLLSCLFFVGSFISIYLSYTGRIGVTYIASRIIAGNPVNIQMVFQATRKFFWRVVASTLLFSLFFGLIVVVCLGLFFTIFIKKLPQFSDLPLIFFIVSIPLSFFMAPRYFIYSEIIVSDSGIGKSMENAWNLFIENFVTLAVIGFILSSVFYIANVTVGTLIILFQHNFDFSALSGFNFFMPQLSFSDNKLHNFLVLAVFGTVWNTFSISIFMLAYLKYRGQIE
jgi:hypothetical protein